MKKSKDSKPFMTFEEIRKIISSQLLEADIEHEAVEDIMIRNQNMYKNYDKDKHLDQVILNHKIEAVIEIVLSDKAYIKSQTISTQGYKKIKNVLKDKQ